MNPPLGAVQLNMKSKALILGIVLGFLVQGPSLAMMRPASLSKGSYADFNAQIAGIPIPTLMAIFGMIGPVGRHALGELAHPFVEFLNAMRAPYPEGLEWTDGLAREETEGFEESPFQDFHPVQFGDWVVTLDFQNCKLNLVSRDGKETVEISVGRSPKQPVASSDLLYVSSREGLIIIDHDLKSKALRRGSTPHAPFVRGRWVFVVDENDGTLNVLDKDLAHQAVKTLDLGGILFPHQPEIVGNELLVAVARWSTKVTVAIDLGGFEELREGAFLPLPQQTILFFECLGPHGRQCLREVPNFYSAWLLDMQAPKPQGFNWVDVATLGIERHFDISRAAYLQGIVYIAAANLVYAVVAKTGDLYAGVRARRPSKPVVLGNRIYVAVSEGLMVFEKPFTLIQVIKGIGKRPLRQPILVEGVLYIASPTQNAVYCLAEDTLQLLDTISVGSPPQRPVTNNHCLYVKAGRVLYTIGRWTHTIIEEKTDGEIPIDALGLNEGFYSYGVDTEQRVIVRDRQSGEVLTSISAGGSPQMTFVGSYLFVLTSDGTRSRVSVFDPQANHHLVTYFDLEVTAEQMFVVYDEMWIPQNRGEEAGMARIKLTRWL